MRPMVLIATFLFARLFFAQQGLPPQLEPAFADASSALLAGKLNDAEKGYLDILQRGGKVAFVYSNLGIVYQQRQDYERAITQFCEAIRLDPTFTAPRILLGDSLLAVGRLPEAAHVLEDAVKLQPLEPKAHLELARSYERLGNLAGVVQQFKVLREIAPTDPEYTYLLGRSYLKLAAQSFERIAAIAPHSARFHQILGENYQMQGQLDMAIQAFQRAANAAPTLPGIHLALAHIYFEKRDSTAARDELKRELQLVPESTAALELKQKIESDTLR